jgi:hypothetical protein
MLNDSSLPNYHIAIDKDRTSESPLVPLRFRNGLHILGDIKCDFREDFPRILSSLEQLSMLVTLKTDQSSDPDVVKRRTEYLFLFFWRLWLPGLHELLRIGFLINSMYKTTRVIVIALLLWSALQTPECDLLMQEWMTSP